MDGSFRGTKFIPLKDISDAAIEICRKKYSIAQTVCKQFLIFYLWIVRGHNVKACVVQRHINLSQVKPGADINNNLQVKWNCKLDVWWDSAMKNMSEKCDPVWIDAEDPLFILYTR